VPPPLLLLSRVHLNRTRTDSNFRSLTRDVLKSDPESPLRSFRALSCPERAPRLLMGAL
jgi:hypothetical protein